jgi:hypothetical protein
MDSSNKSDDITRYGSGTAGGVGYGNKSDAAQESGEYNNSQYRFDKADDTSPVMGSTKSVGSTGFGNHTTDGFNKPGV